MMPVTRFIKIEPHDLKAYLRAKLSPQHRATILSYNEKCARWVYGEVTAPNAKFPFHFKFRHSEAEVEASVAQFSDSVCADIDKCDVLDTDDPESFNWDLVMAQLRR
ncbi:hypothetical protein F25303_13746 [Fusarium sp. NRRL 25303]|nr:hypothetical protein F25303_13746 [Fusarium sp. NRRL 25303]